LEESECQDKVSGQDNKSKKFLMILHGTQQEAKDLLSKIRYFLPSDDNPYSIVTYSKKSALRWMDHIHDTTTMENRFQTFYPKNLLPFGSFSPSPKPMNTCRSDQQNWRSQKNNY
jgi:hypothetical protein